MQNAKNQNNENWVFVPVLKERVIKTLEKAVMLKLDDGASTIMPLVFKRKKETETHIFLSLPKDFKINVRFSNYDFATKSYVNVDREYGVLYNGVRNKYLEMLNTPVSKEESIEE